MNAFTESVVEEAALAWLESVGWQVQNGDGIAAGEPRRRVARAGDRPAVLRRALSKASSRNRVGDFGHFPVLSPVCLSGELA